MAAMSGSHPALRVHDLTVRDRETGAALLDQVSFEAKRGAAIGIVGDSGAGKSTLALALTGLLPDRLDRMSTSELWLGDTALHALAPDAWRTVRGRRIAMVFQEPLLALDPAMRVGAQVIEAGMAHGLSHDESERRALDLFARLALPDPARLARRYPHELSGGMRQRVLLAMAMLHGPELLIADEATTALDPALRHSVLDALDALRREMGTTLLLISHDHAVVSARCDRILTMAEGRIVGDVSVAARSTSLPTTISSSASSVASPARRHSRVAGGPPILTVRDLVVEYAQAALVHDATAVTRAVDGLSFTIDRAEVIGLIGPSGSGKTSVARAILRLTAITRGTIHLDTTDLASLRGRALRQMRRRLQWIPQDAGAALTPHLRVEALVAEGLEVHGIARGTEALRRARALLDEVGLPARAASARPSALSTGERQRVALARALATNPDLLVCDEPVANLDPARRTQILDLLAALQRTRDLSILLISHDEAAIERLASRVLTMYFGHWGAPAAP